MNLNVINLPVIAGILTNLINIVTLSLAVKRRGLPTYRVFLGMAVADLMVSIHHR